jgi:hypothetical protein
MTSPSSDSVDALPNTALFEGDCDSVPSRPLGHPEASPPPDTDPAFAGSRDNQIRHLAKGTIAGAIPAGVIQGSDQQPAMFTVEADIF